MNQFASTENSQGLLKNAYETEPVSEALKRKRIKMMKELREKAGSEPAEREQEDGGY